MSLTVVTKVRDSEHTLCPPAATSVWHDRSTSNGESLTITPEDTWWLVSEGIDTRTRAGAGLEVRWSTGAECQAT